MSRAPGALADRFRQLTGAPPEGVWQAPGRVNLIGEHTDYNDGLALPFAIQRGTLAALRRRPDRSWRCWSLQRPGEPVGPLEAAGLGPGTVEGWAAYPLGAVWALAEAGIPVPGADVVVDADLPIGAGLSSSASLIAAVAVGAVALAGETVTPDDLVEACHAAEAAFVGAPTGTLDQRAVLLAEAGHGVVIDFRSGVTATVPLTATLPVVVVDTGVRHDHTTGGYGQRRRECERAAEGLGVASLRDATLDTVAAAPGLDGRLRARARHVVTEDARVLDAAARLRAGEGIADLLFASHASLRDDFEVSCPELDAVVEAAARAGAHGARMTGGGFGGCAIVAGLPLEDVEEAVGEEFARRGWPPPRVWAVEPAAGAGRLA